MQDAYRMQLLLIRPHASGCCSAVCWHLVQATSEIHVVCITLDYASAHTMRTCEALSCLTKTGLPAQ